jgi:hypothetical protein
MAVVEAASSTEAQRQAMAQVEVSKKEVEEHH